MATKQEIEKHLKDALSEIGEIRPRFDKAVNAWVFSHKLYPVEYAGDSYEEVIKNYPKYLKEFIKERLKDNLNPLVEKKTKGRGGKRAGAGRPKGSQKNPTKTIRVPIEFVDSLQELVKGHSKDLKEVARGHKTIFFRKIPSSQKLDKKRSPKRKLG